MIISYEVILLAMVLVGLVALTIAAYLIYLSLTNTVTGLASFVGSAASEVKTVATGIVTAVVNGGERIVNYVVSTGEAIAVALYSLVQQVLAGLIQIGVCQRQNLGYNGFPETF